MTARAVAVRELATGLLVGLALAVAMGLPALLRATGVDPASGSGPLATVVQDVLSTVIYLWITTRLVG